MNLALKNLEDIKKIEKEKKVFLIGMLKTGTTSLEYFLEELGYRVCKGHWNSKETNFLCACYCFNQVDEILNITNYYDAFGDAPWGGTNLYKKLSKMYPNAYFILSTRDVNQWYDSYINMYKKYDTNLRTTMETMRSFGAYGNYIFFKKIFDIKNLQNSEKKIKRYFERYNDEVRKYFIDKTYNFMEIDITSDNFDLGRLKKFLKKEKYNVEIKHLNQGKY